MKPIAAFLLLLFSTWNLFPQTTDAGYELPKPLPTNGATPATIIKPGGSFGPTSYSDPRPGVYDKFIWGGHRSYGTLAERNAAKWKIEGMLAYVASDQKTYRLMPDLSTWVEAFIPFGGSGWTNSIYTADDAITGNRVVTLDGHVLLFTGIGASAYQVNVGGGISLTSGTRIDLISTTNIYLQSPEKIYLTSGIVDITGTNGINLDGSGQFTVTGANVDLSSSAESTIASAGKVLIQGNSISNAAGRIDLVSTTNIYLQSPVNIFLTSGSVDVTATNSVSFDSFGQLTISGASVDFVGQTDATLSSSGPVSILGQTITNSAGTIYQVASTNLILEALGITSISGDTIAQSATSIGLTALDSVTLNSVTNISLSSAAQIQTISVTLTNRATNITIIAADQMMLRAGSVTNISSVYDQLANQSYYLRTVGPAHVSSESLMMSGTNLMSFDTACQMTFTGSSIHSSSITDTDITSVGPITISGLSITKTAGTISQTSTGATSSTTVGTNTVTAGGMSITGTNVVTVKSSGILTVDGAPIKLITANVRAVTATVGQVVTLANTNGSVEFADVSTTGGVPGTNSLLANRMSFVNTNSIFMSSTASGSGVEANLGGLWVYKNGGFRRNYANIMFEINSWGVTSTSGDTATWTLVGGGTVSGIGGTAGHAGINTLNTTVATNTMAGLGWRNDAIDFEAGNKLYMFCRLRLPTLAISGGEAYRAMAGFGDASTATLYDTDCIHISYGADEGGVWNLDCATATVHTVTPSVGAVVANTWYDLEIEATSTSVSWWVNGVAQTPGTTNIPTGTAKFSPMVRIVSYNGGGAATKVMHLDAYNAYGVYAYQ